MSIPGSCPGSRSQIPEKYDSLPKTQGLRSKTGSKSAIFRAQNIILYGKSQANPKISGNSGAGPGKIFQNPKKLKMSKIGLPK